MIAGIIYPVVGHWIWGGMIEGTEPGWLRQLGFLDFAGSTVVHSVGGWVALAAVVTVGPRIGRFGPGGRPIEGHDLTLATLGMFILWLGWFGFNGGSNLGVDDRLPNIITNTVLAGVFGGLAGLLTAWLITRRPEVPRILNGIISGLVAITASANIATLGGAAVIGFIAGVIAAAGFALLERLRVDDAIGVIPVHLFRRDLGQPGSCLVRRSGRLHRAAWPSPSAADPDARCDRGRRVRVRHELSAAQLDQSRDALARDP
jgi:Amt family ammonium transporter